MKETVIAVKNIGKKYIITHEQGGYVALRDVLTNIFRTPLKFFTQKAKEVVGISKKEEFWALRNIHFEVRRGEVIGIIGKNGAGKSTILKILSQITPPTEGEIRIEGRVGSLLEVGTGFHPELSGRENIFLNGAILGMTKKEIVKKFDDIVTFAGIEKFLDTPVKFYSSGMYVRLAFSVAAHMEPDILIIDEVLAVGDAEFQKKCLGKMDEITKKQGRTILFVSHNTSIIRELCSRCIVLDKGKIQFDGNTEEAIETYIKLVRGEQGRSDVSAGKEEAKEANGLSIQEVSIINSENRPTSDLLFGEPFSVEVAISSRDTLKNISIGVRIESEDGHPITSPTSGASKKLFDLNPTSALRVKARIADCTLVPGQYWITVSATRHDQKLLEIMKIKAFFVGADSYKDTPSYTGGWGVINSNPEWSSY
ncbi:MAG: ABC transporter ATP-binding protein [Candidatus Pacebacteria bacterium]|nr:ABC transporter ATP-binding protein [Candidatus Paceibacterota bacterium]